MREKLKGNERECVQQTNAAELVLLSVPISGSANETIYVCSIREHPEAPEANSERDVIDSIRSTKGCAVFERPQMLRMLCRIHMRRTFNTRVNVCWYVCSPLSRSILYIESDVLYNLHTTRDLDGDLHLCSEKGIGCVCHIHSSVVARR